MKKKIAYLLILLLTIVCVPVYAIEKTDNGFHADQEISLKKSFNTSTFVAGNNVKISSEVDGLNFVAGNNVTLSSKQDYLFTAGNSIVLEGVEAKDVFVAGNSVQINNSSIRDLYVAASTIVIDSYISRNVRAAGDRVVINSTIDGDVYLAAENIVIGEEAIIVGTLSYPEESYIEVGEGSSIGEQKTYESKGDVSVEVTPKDLVVEFITSFVGLLIIAFILLAIHKPLFKSLRKEEQEAGNVVKKMAIGFGVLIGLPICAIICLITIVGIPLSIIGLILYGVAIYLSSIPTAFFVGNWVMKDKKVNEYLLLACSLLALQILKVIPAIGGLVGFLSLILGLGLLVNFVVQAAQDKKETKK